MEHQEEDIRQLVQVIASRLNEREPSARFNVRTVLLSVGTEKTFELVRDAVEIEEKGGMMILNGKRRRTLGGIFFYLAKERYAEKLPDSFWRNGKRPNSPLKTPIERAVL